jgi:acyl-CoA hydrolase
MLKPKSRTLAKRYVRNSVVEMTQLVLPNDTNQLGNLLGGRLMEWMDVAAAISAQRHSSHVCVTAAVDELEFHQPIRLGEVVTIRSTVNRAFTTSMEIGINVLTENHLTCERKISNTAYMTFVAIDNNRNPVKIPPIIPTSLEEKRRYKEALRRRNIRLQRRSNAGK